MARKIKKQSEPVDMVLEDGVLYLVVAGRREVVRPAIPRHRPYRDAYRKLYGKLGYLPKDGKYRFTGKKMRKLS